MKRFRKILKGKRIVLKLNKPNIETAQVIFEQIKNERKHYNEWTLFLAKIKTVKDELKYLSDIWDLSRKNLEYSYGIYLNDQCIGVIGIFDVDDKNKSAEIGYWLVSTFTKQGYATESVKLLESHAFSIGLNRIQIKCHEHNVASAGVAKKCMYKFEGILRQDRYLPVTNTFRNSLVFSKLKSEWEKK